MAFGFHGPVVFLNGCGLTLPGFVARVSLVDDVDFAATADYLAVRVPFFRGFDGGDDFHKVRENTDRRRFCQTKCGNKRELS